MDSSRKESVIPATVPRTGFSPWQVSRIRDRLANYKSAVRQGWERIALDILDDMDQDEDYVDAEDVRPFSESLRRLVAGSQTPSEERLTAICIFLGNKGYLALGDLEENRDHLQVPLAFHEFIAAGDGGAEKALSNLKAYQGRFSYIVQAGLPQDNQYRHLRLGLNFEGGAVAASMSDSRLNRIDTLRRLKGDNAVRKRALQFEIMHAGFAVGLPNGRMVVFVKPAAYDELYSSHVFLVWAKRKPAQEGEELSSLMVMDYAEAGEVEDLEKAHEHLTATERTGILIGLPVPQFLIFDRD